MEGRPCHPVLHLNDPISTLDAATLRGVRERPIPFVSLYVPKEAHPPLQMNGKARRCSRSLIFRGDNLVDFLSRFLIVKRPCELEGFKVLLIMQLCGSTSGSLRFQPEEKRFKKLVLW